MMRFGIKGAAVLQVWLLIFGFVGVALMMGTVSGQFPKGEEAPEDKKTPGNDNIAPVVSAAPAVITGSDAAAAKKLKDAADAKKLKDAEGLKGKEWFSEGTISGGIMWVIVAYYAGEMLGGALGMNEDNSKALADSLAAGTAAWQLSTYYFKSSAKAAGWWGFGVGAVVFLATYKNVETKTASFTCMPWQAPTGGNNCEECNIEGLPCSEYRCRSLGQSCEIVNEGSVEERCVYVNPRDVNPPVITPLDEFLTANHTYTNYDPNPPSPGFDIENTASGRNDVCLEAFTPLEFGFNTDEPAQCKISLDFDENFDEMITYVGGSNSYKYNHTDEFSLPGAKELQSSGFTLTNGKDMSFFIRCRDKSGNENENEYAVNFCIDPSPDTTAPRLEATSIESGSCVAQGNDNASVIFYTNEPAECKWSFQDQNYASMGNNMTCWTDSNNQAFVCDSVLTGIPRDGADYYVRCNDTKGNVMATSFPFRLRGSTGLILENLKPNGTIFGGVSPSPIELYAETLLGCNNGLARCSWSTTDGSGYIQFFDSYNEDGIHAQRLDLTAGQHEYFVKCEDDGGNVAEDNITFDLDIDTNAPAIARVYEEEGMLKIVTVRDSECSYSLESCNFAVDDGIEMPWGNTTEHVAEWDKDLTYYIKCRDEFRSEGNACALIVRPTENFL